MPSRSLILSACRRAASAETGRLGRGINSLVTNLANALLRIAWTLANTLRH